MATWIFDELGRPTPIGTAVSSLAFVLVIGFLVFLANALRPKKKAPEDPNGLFSRTRRLISSIDRGITHFGAWITGTRHHSQTVRWIHVPATFLALTALSAIAPWPWGIVVIIVGMVAILGVFRHWSRHEDEALENVDGDKREIRIYGNLNVEVSIAVAFLFVFAPLAFAQLQAAGLGFQIAPDAGPFTFLLHTLIETAKAGSLVDYYDIYAQHLNFERFSGVREPSPWAKMAVVAYRLSINALVLTVLKRLLDIWQRKAEGLDLRHIEDQLRRPEEAEQLKGIEELEDFARRGKANARDLLERVLVPKPSDGWHCKPMVRSRAADALRGYAEKWGGIGALHAAVGGYQTLLREEWSKERDAEKWGATQNSLGAALESLADQTGDAKRREEAIAAYHLALEVRRCDAMRGPWDPVPWAETQLKLSVALSRLADQTGDATRREEAITAYRLLLEYYTPVIPTGWAMTEDNLTKPRNRPADQTGDAKPREEAIAAFGTVQNFVCWPFTEAEGDDAWHDVNPR